jgi:hypothetical protein
MPNLVRRLLDRAAARQPYVPPHFPERGDPVETWLLAKRNERGWHGTNDRTAFNLIDGLLHDYQRHADTGTALDQDPEPLVSDTELQARLAAAHTEVARRKEAPDA